MQLLARTPGKVLYVASRAAISGVLIMRNLCGWPGFVACFTSGFVTRILGSGAARFVCVCAVGAGALSPLAVVAQSCEAGWLAEATPDTINPESFRKAEGFAAHPSGDMIISGYFTPRGDWPHQGIVRYNPATNTFIQMGSGTAGWFYVAALPDGDVVSWTSPQSDPPIQGIARYDFETEVWSSIGSARPQSILKMEAAPDGGLFVCGSFTSIGSLAVNGIARLDTETGVWSVLGEGLSGSVSSFAVSPDGVVVASGGFTASGAVPLLGVATFDPAIGEWVQLPGSTFAFTQIVIGANGDIYGLRRWSPRSVAYRYDQVQQAWIAVGAGTVPQISLRNIAIRPDGALVCLASNGASILQESSDAWVELGTQGVFGGYSIGVASNNDVYVGGHLQLEVSNTGSIKGIARYQEQYGEWTHLGRGLDDQVTEFVDADDGTVWIGGRFRTVDGQPAGRVARFDPARREFMPVHTSPLLVVESLSANSQFGLVASTRSFVPFNGVSIRSIWSYDDAAKSWRGIGKIDSPSQYPWAGIRDVVTLPGGDLLALRSGYPPGLSRMNATTGRWTQLAAGSFQSGLLLPSGEVVLAGAPVQLFDPATNQLRPLPMEPDHTVSARAFALLPDGDLLIAGSYSRLGEIMSRGLVRYDFDTSVLSDFGGGVSGTTYPTVYAIRMTPDGRVLIAGSFTHVGLGASQIPARSIAEFDPATNTWRSFGSGLEGGIAYAIHPMPDGGFLAGGAFTRAGGRSSLYLARWASANPPVILRQPRPALLCSGGEILMSFGVGSTREAAFRWQWQPPASSEWVDLVEGDNFVGDVPVLAASGVDRRSITASALEGLPAESPIQIRCIVTTPCGEVVSDAASLTRRAPCACYDFNRDLEIDLADAADMAAVFTGLRLSEAGWLDGDLNGDENADLTDAQLLAAFVVSGNCGV